MDGFCRNRIICRGSLFLQLPLLETPSTLAEVMEIQFNHYLLKASDGRKSAASIKIVTVLLLRLRVERTDWLLLMLVYVSSQNRT
jgi:hypothetical protein